MPARARKLRRWSVVTMVIVGMVTGACGRNREQASGEAYPNRDTPAQLTIENQHWLDIVVSVLHDGEMTRVGTVTAASTEDFWLASWMLGQERLIRLVGDPVGGRDEVRTEPLKIQPGQMIEWRLESQLARSWVMVY